MVSVRSSVMGSLSGVGRHVCCIFPEKVGRTTGLEGVIRVRQGHESMALMMGLGLIEREMPGVCCFFS